MATELIQETPTEPQVKQIQHHGNRLATAIATAAIAQDHISGMTALQIAEKYGITTQGAYYHIRKYRTEQMADRNGSWRSQLRVYAIKGITAGLRCPDDPYRRGDLGVKVLKGLGDFEGDSSPVQVNIGVREDDLTARYLAIHGRYPTDQERLELAAKPVEGERVEDREEV